jgi:putative DNA methylase
VDLVVMDPPYYDNVMYAELSDFFYVWLKRTAGYVYPELFRRALTDKEHEAVANPAKFRGEKGAKDPWPIRTIGSAWPPSSPNAGAS